MSEVVEKTLSSLASGLGVVSDRDGGTSRGFQAFVKHISHTKTKHEVEQAVQREINLQKQKLAHPDLSMVQKRESLIRLVYCDMLGGDVSFACIHAIKLAHQGSILEKRVGYLVSSLWMHPEHELVMLLVCSMQKDLLSTNVLENLTALTAIAHLCSSEIVPLLLPAVKDTLRHPKDAVRKKAVLCMHYFLCCAPDMVTNDLVELRQLLSDRDPSVVWAALHVFDKLIQKDPASYLDLVPGLISILVQVIGRKLPTDYDFHTVPGPWITILLLRLLGRLGAHEQSASEKIYPVLKEVLQRTEPSHKIGLAVIFECLQTITTIYPYPQLVEHAIACVGRFLSAKNINLKYLGLKALVAMVTVSPKCTVEHQDVVLDCLEHTDPTIQRMSMELLYKMASEKNVAVICNKMMEFMERITDKFIRVDIVNKITQLTERFGSDLLWYVDTMNQLILSSKEDILSTTADTMLWKISQTCACKGDQLDPMSNKQLGSEVFMIYWKLLQDEPQQPETILRVVAWVFGEYSHCAPDVQPKQVLSSLLLCYNDTPSVRARCCIISALQKLVYYVSNTDELITTIKSVNNSRKNAVNTELKQRMHELEGLCRAKQAMKIAVNPETRPDLSQLDLSLSFLDAFVCKALENGASPYRPRGIRTDGNPPGLQLSVSTPSLNFTPYQAPVALSKVGSLAASRHSGQFSMTGSTSSNDAKEPSLQVQNVKKVWGKAGVLQEEKEPDAETNPYVEIPQTNMTGSQQLGSASMSSSTRVTLTPDQQKRKELASAIFGGIKIDKPDTIGDLVSISESDKTSSTIFPENTPLELPSLEMGLFEPNESESVDQIERTSTQDAVCISPENPFFSEEGRSDPSCTGLLDAASLLSPDEQIPKGSLYQNFIGIENKNTQENNSEPSIENKSSNKNVEYLSSVKSMYDDFVVSSQSTCSTFDDFVHTAGNEQFETSKKEQDNDSEKINSTGAPCSSSQSPHPHPSPWKMIGSQPRNNLADGSTEDSISIEVDSIEDDDPPTEFIIENIHQTETIEEELVSLTMDDLESLPKSEPMVLLKRSDYTVKCQKVFREECLVLVLHITCDNSLQSGDETVSCHVENMNDYYVKEQQIANDDQPSSTTWLLSLRPKDKPSTKTVEISMILPPSEESCLVGVQTDVSDFLRTCSLSVEQFGSLWTSDEYCFLRRAVLPTPQSHDGESPITVLEDIGFGIIQTVGSEVILSSQWLNDSAHPILMHCRPAGDLQLQVKGQEEVVYEVIQFIQSQLTDGS